MLTEALSRDGALFDDDPVYNDMATVFAPAANVAASHARHLAPPPGNRASRGAVAAFFALVAMLAGVAGLAASHYWVTSPPPAIPASAPARTFTPPTRPPAPTPVPLPQPATPPPAIRLALSRPPSLPPIAPPTPSRALLPVPVAKAAPASHAVIDPSRSQRTPHLTGAALARALAQDVIDTRKLNDGILRDGAVTNRTVPARNGTP